MSPLNNALSLQAESAPAGSHETRDSQRQVRPPALPPEQEAARLQALHRYDILDTPPEREFDDIVSLAALVSAAPVALITFTASARCWFKARLGMSASEVSREISFCSHVIGLDGLLIVADAPNDARFRANPLVLEDPRIRAYAGAPLVTPDGHHLGAVCVVDYVPREFTPEQLRALEQLARQVMALLELRRQRNELEASLAREKAAEAAHRASESRFRRIMDSNMVGILFWDRDGTIWDANDRFLEMVGYSREDLRAGRIKWSELTPPEHASRDVAALKEIGARGVCTPFEKDYVRNDGRRLPVLLGGALLDGHDDRGVCFVIDVSDRKSIEEELRRERNLLRTLIDHLPDYIYVKDLESRHLVNNRANVALLGVQSPEQALGRSVTDFLPADMARKYIEADREVFRTGKPLIERIEEIVGSQGERRWISTTKVPLRGSSGDITGLVGISRDVTDRMRAEQLLADQRNLFRSTLDNLPLCVFVVNCEARFIVNNNAHLQLFGLEGSEQAYGRTFADIAPPHVAARELAEIQDVIATRRPILHREQEVTDHLGFRRVHLVSKVPMFNATGGVHAVIGISQDITDRRLAQAQIEKLAAFPKFNPNPVLEFSHTGELTYFNAAAEAMTATVGCHHPREIVPHNVADIVRGCLATGEPRLRLETTLGGRTISWSFFPVPASNAVHCYAGDITERLALEARLRHAQRLEAVGQLAGGVAHDFNNILTVVQGHASLMLAEQLSPELQDSAHQIAAAAERAANLTRQLLAFGRRQLLQPRNLDLNEVVATIARMLQRVLGTDILLAVRYASNLPPVHADPGMMEQVLVNLVMNSRDAMPKGGRLDIQLKAVALDAATAAQHPDARAGMFVVLTVADTGCGIPQENLEHIFEPFFTTKDVGRGTGLGLATVHGIVNQHHGWIQVESAVGRGTTFSIYFPVSTVKAATASPEPTRPVRGGSECILLVEDEEPLRELVRCILESFGYTVIEAPNGKVALEVWRANSHRVDMLLTDIVMPEGVTGRDLADLLKQEKPSLRVLFTSGYSSEIVGKDFVLADGINFLQKPYSPQTLAETVRDCLDR
jgi:two-component system, cell cycle sensor histidine kinase and response regulator CckA